MGYHKMKIEDLYSIFNRWLHHHRISQISTLEGFDRKTIRQYIQKFTAKKFVPGGQYKKEEVLPILLKLLPANKKNQPVREDLLKYAAEIKELLNHSPDAVKMITAYRIIKQKYHYKGCYETFKLFVHHQGLKKTKNKTMIRIELPPAREIQIDYGKAGLLFDPDSNKNKVIYAFCGILSHSRLPFIQFVQTQNQTSFVESNINMLDFFVGSTDFISLDNLKSGVIKPDLYDPKLNRTYQEMAEYYGVFINPCRVATPTDKGKIERFIQVARELFKEIKHLEPNIRLSELNKRAKRWCKEEYGMREHGTTKEAPLLVYQQVEQMALKPLPAEPFEICSWHHAKVHPDQFITVNKKRYSLPAKYIGTQVWVKRSSKKVMIHQDFKMIRFYFIPKNSFAYIKTDFPEVLREMMCDGYPKYLLKKAHSLGKEAYRLIENILTPHAYLNSRRARGALDILEKYRFNDHFTAICEKALQKSIQLPKSLKIFFEEETEQLSLDFNQSEISETGKKMIRGIEYYIN